MRKLVTGGTVVTETGMIENGYILIVDGQIVDYGHKENTQKDVDEVFELNETDIIMPGFIDIHIHGAAGHDTMDATEEALRVMAETLPKEGTTSFLATTITDTDEHITDALRNAAKFSKTDYDGAEMLGVHLEGPFISLQHAGAQPESCIIPSSIELFEKWQKAAEGLIRVVTLAPEEKNGMELVRYLGDNDVIPSIGHSHATFDEVSEAVNHGLKHATHLFNAMRPMHHREPGVVGAVFLNASLLAEIIFDRIHVTNEMVRLAYRTLGSDRMMLITDSMRGKCLREGTYDLGGQEVTINGGEARLANGTLAGSVLKMSDAVRHLSSFEESSELDVMKMASWNAAKSLGVDDRKGSIKKGKDADLVVLDSELSVKQTFCRGNKVNHDKMG
ncbi:N-acetylglucosamine-6-phosphate deacetylase [Halobacillus mangrovi]|uniref:N-acetylglucosamine-6-phosphate deacetylase n=1 Tax=Halobacillus mangrovi TaxID=402384 RepID=A0A1W5ZT19_9BACI|nr:N-acetylglucosamine-6-phosphate deacetylase [Halobacillus mangrovi]ARI76442.1 N-acetylglucosamine-6-phosphate deacetylase [Halobacillus mangrovi]